MNSFFPTLAIIWRLAIPYFRSDQRWIGRILLGSVIAVELATVAVTVLINQWNNTFYNAVQNRDWNVFVWQLGYFSLLAGIYVTLRAYQNYLNQWLQIRWRGWMTKQYLDHWLATANHYRMQLLGDTADNPDQRIAEDIKQFIELTLYIGIGVLSSTVSFFSFVAILWALSAEAPLSLFGTQWNIPGYLVWIALIYSVLGTAITHLIGRALIRINFNQQRFEADFRFNLVRVRENAEQIALLKGEYAERERLLGRFSAVINNWFTLISRQKRLAFFTNSFNQIAIILPYVVSAPAYFASKIQLGGFMQISSTFSNLQAALSFFADVTYLRFAEWRAVIARLDGFNKTVIHAQQAALAEPVIDVEEKAPLDGIAIDDLLVRLPRGAPLITSDNLSIAAGERVLVTGPSGSGKSTLFRAIAGIWPFGKGEISVPTGSKLMMLPQRPYFPITSLAGALSYPADTGAFSEENMTEVLNAVGLSKLASRLHEEEHWNRMLSLGEQQRLGIARAILHNPDFLFLDEATASLDEESEGVLYRLLQKRLAHAAMISIGHRAELANFHQRGLVLAPAGDIYRLGETKPRPVA